MSTQERIEPIIRRTYGGNAMAERLAHYLVELIEAWEPDELETREDMIRDTCWNWFAGGSTAELVARQIEEALKAEA